jgi:indolepyruvate ferredoxin oxidoreductase
MRATSHERTLMVLNTAEVPTGSMVVHPDRGFPADELDERLAARGREQVRVDATRVVRERFGDDSAVNVYLLGVAFQEGLLPLSAESIERAIELNGVAVAKNLAAFRWGRAWATDPIRFDHTVTDTYVPDSGSALHQRLHDDLVGFQSRRYARRFDEVVAMAAATGSDELTDAVARNLHRLMAYKDEYEVARLLLLPKHRRGVVWHLHPPILRYLGVQHKIRLGQWATPLLAALRSMKRLRGTPFDPFGYSTVRRLERTLVRDYIAALTTILPAVGEHNRAAAMAIAELPDAVRGYETLKLERGTAFRANLAEALARFSR